MGIDFRSLYDAVKAECEIQGKDMMTASIADLPMASSHGSGVAFSTMVYGIVDSCKPKKRRKQKS